MRWRILDLQARMKEQKPGETELHHNRTGVWVDLGYCSYLPMQKSANITPEL